MSTVKQRAAAGRNVKTAQEAWPGMSSRADAGTQPEGGKRRKAGTAGKGEHCHIEGRPEAQFTAADPDR
jgi:hypothetical protein